MDVTSRGTKGSPSATYPVPPCTVSAAKISSFGAVVVAGPLSAVALAPAAATLWSTGFEGSAPAYSKMRSSGKLATALSFTVTALLPPEMFLA